MVILNLLLAVAMIEAAVTWIHALINHDGTCHYEDCAACPYRGNCPQERRSK